MTTPQDLDERFRVAVAALTRGDRARRPADEPVRDGTGLTGDARARTLFDAQLTSRHLDLAGRAGCAASARATTRSGRPGTRATRRSRRRCGRPTRRCCTTAPARSTAPAPPRLADGADRTPPATCCAAWSRRPTSRSPAGGTRCSATPTCTSSRPPRRSPRTCRARSALAFAIERGRPPACRRAAGDRRRPGPRRDRGLLVRRRVGQPRQRHRRVQHRRLVRPHRPARCRCCSSARTTAWASACARPTGWVAAALRSRPGLRYFERRRLRPRRRRTTSPSRPSPRYARHRRPAVLHLSHGAADGPRRRRRRDRPTARPPRSTATWPATRSWPPPGCSSRPAWPRPTRC